MTLTAELRRVGREERLLVLANLLMQIGFQSTYFICFIGIATYRFAADAFVVSALIFLLNVTISLGNAVVGVVIDRIGPRRTLLITLAAYALLGIVCALVHLTLPLLFVLCGVFGLLHGFMSTATMAYPPFLTDDPETLKRLNSLSDTATNIAIIAGPAIGGFIVQASGEQTVFVLFAACIASAIVPVYACRELLHPDRASGKDARPGAHPDTLPESARPDGPSLHGEGTRCQGKLARFWREFMEGLRVTFASRSLRFIFIVGFLGNFAYGAFDSLESLYYRDVLLLSSDWMGWLSSIMGVGCVVGSLLMLRLPADRVNESLLSLMLMVCGMGSMLYTGTRYLGCAMAGQMVCGFGYGLMIPVQHLLTQRNCDLAYLGRVTSVLRLASLLAGTVPLLIAPFIAAAVGVQAVLFGAATFVALVGACALVGARRRERALH